MLMIRMLPAAAELCFSLEKNILMLSELSFSAKPCSAGDQIMVEYRSIQREIITPEYSRFSLK